MDRINAPTTDESRIVWLSGLYGDNPSKVGSVDGTEDDYGDMIGDLLSAIGIEDTEAFPAVEDALSEAEPSTWEAALAVVRKAVQS